MASNSFSILVLLGTDASLCTSRRLELTFRENKLTWIPCGDDEAQSTTLSSHLVMRPLADTVCYMSSVGLGTCAISDIGLERTTDLDQTQRCVDIFEAQPTEVEH